MQLGKEGYLLGCRDDKGVCDYDGMNKIHRMLAAGNRSRGKPEPDNFAAWEAGQRETDLVEAAQVEVKVM